MPNFLKLNSYIGRFDSVDNNEHYKDENFNRLSTTKEAFTYIADNENPENTEKLLSFLGENKTLIVFSNFFYDVYEKIEYLKTQFNFNILFLDGTLTPYFDQDRGLLRANLFDVVHFLLKRRKHENILFFSVNAVWKLVILDMLRDVFPKIKIVVYKYDWLSLFCPYEHKVFLKQFLNLPEEAVNSEYKVLDDILSGKIANGILFKDGGTDFKLLKAYNNPKLYMPACLPKKLYQKPPALARPLNRFLHIGKFFSDIDYVPELFKDVFLFEPIQAVSDQGYRLDAYYARSSKATVNNYKKYFSGNMNVNFFEGKPLNRLLPEIAGNHHWGYLINNYSHDYHIIQGHVENALPARIFTFMALGLPTVVSSELTYTSWFVNHYNIGVDIPADQLKNVHQILKKIDYKKLQANVIDIRNELCFEKYQSRFRYFINEIMDSK